ncbi:hypothetical protein BH11MYX1_BH11MYX1_21030 [soil metagenome]
MVRRPRAEFKVGDSRLAERFYAGRYADILADTYDAGAAVAPEDLAFVVGALTFVDRVDEATAQFDAWRARSAWLEPRIRAACVFFLGLAAARAGYFERANALLVRRAFPDRHDPDPWVRSLVFQGLACQCYFTGRYPGAARHALRALQAAHEAGFAYVALLATDMRGHALVQMGQLQRGISLLEQAKKQASRLGQANTAFAVDTSIATYGTRFVPDPSSLDRIAELLERDSHDSYSRRALLTEAAVQRAVRGQRVDAVEALEAADRDALRGDTRRGKVVSLLARLWVTRFQRGTLACTDLIDQARGLVEPRDIAFRSELLAFEILGARVTSDGSREARTLAELRGLLQTTQHFHARSALAQFEPLRPARAFDEDAVMPILRAVAQRDVLALSRIVALGWLGLIPELLGLSPGRRIILIPSEDLVLLEDHGNVLVRTRPPRWCPVLLRILASGDATKERIVAGLWGLRAYHPEIHDPPVRTTIHRLRSFLAPYGSWIEVTDLGYRVTVPVHLVSGAEPAMLDPLPLWEEGEVPMLRSMASAIPPRPASANAPARASLEQRVYQRLAELEQASVPELARALKMSASTVLRTLRDLVEEDRVERVGFARATRYRPRSVM